MNNNPIYEISDITNLRELVEHSSNKFQDKNAFLIKKNNEYIGISFNTFKNNVYSLGTYLFHKLKLKRTPIAIIGENRYEWCLSYLSIASSNNIVVPIDKELPNNEIENLLLKSKSQVVIFSSKYEKLMLKIFKNNPTLKYLINMDLEQNSNDQLSIFSLIENGTNIIKKTPSLSIKTNDIDNKNMSTLIFTSGTTDHAKGVMLSQSNIVSNIKSVCSVVYIDEKDRCLSILPLHHTYECTCGFLLMLYRGVTIAFNEGLKYISKNLKEVKPTVLILVPLILENIHKKIWNTASKNSKQLLKLKTALKISNLMYNILNIDLRSKIFKQIHDNVGGNLRLIISGAAAIDPFVTKGLESFGFNILQGYGLTECSPIVTVNRLHFSVGNSIGPALPGVEIKIDNPDSDGIGEIVVKGKNVMLGYYENELATKRILKNGWLYTGDLGKKDSNFYYYITGRKKNVIVTKNGKNIFPEEIESYLNRNKFISESMVKGSNNNSDETVVEAIIYPNIELIKEKYKTSKISKEMIDDLINLEIKNINTKLPIYKKIRSIKIRENEFEKTTTKKNKTLCKLIALVFI